MDKNLVPEYFKQYCILVLHFSRGIDIITALVAVVIGILLLLFIFFLLDSPKNKQTNKQTERTLAGAPQQPWPITAGLDTCLNETRNEHYYILNR